MSITRKLEDCALVVFAALSVAWLLLVAAILWPFWAATVTVRWVRARLAMRRAARNVRLGEVFVD
jgi:hypothetical protein